MDFGFGVTPFTEGTPLQEVYLTETVKDDWSLQLVLMEAYDQTYGIFDHDQFSQMDPLAVIGMHPSENVVSYSKMEQKIREVMGCRLPELANTPLMELMQYPRWLLDSLLADARKAKKKEDTAASQLEAQLQAERQRQQSGG